MSFVAPLVDGDQVVQLIRDPSKQVGKDYLIIDVRDDDFVGGNIPGALNVPANQLVDAASDLAQTYSNVPVIYFHCALSQVRGPKSARIYNEIRHLQPSLSSKDQQVYVIRGGFEGWHARYKDEKDLMENYDADRWANFY
ncbi:Rhodanese-like protein [Chlamydoabsidia padenii]|nr:Rhodanese-like protein [Chlamydoabsidia padenii]